MSKKYGKLTTSLVIVESPAKCKKIEEYLGPGYKCVASFGHLRQLSSLTNIDIANNFHPTYTIIDNQIKKNQIELIRKEIKKADEVIIASDLDREGEGIGNTIIELFKLPLTTKRITFNEITEQAIQTAIKNPSVIDMDMVRAQQARQILDLLVGFKLTPMLWKYITKNSKNSLSAGRCQSPALKIIYENQQEIDKNNLDKKIYKVSGIFTNNNICFDLNSGDKIDSEELIIDFLDESADFEHIYTCSKPEKVYKKPPQPFTTSKIQQASSNQFHYSPKETMKICQKLYEAGYITYMRTDSKAYCKEFINLTKTYIIRNYNDEKYINQEIEKVEKQENNEEAHEAIRPTNISLKDLPDEVDSKEKKLYKLIWENTLESCMSAASFFSITANITSINKYKYAFTSELVDFPGWKIVSKKYTNENKEYTYLQTIKQNSILPYKKIMSKVTIQNIKQHYCEARLVQLLEEKGIGRPSTFSSLVDKIQERGYVKKEDIKGKEIICKDFELSDGEIFEIETKREFGNEKNKLVIQQLGIVVMEFLNENFGEIINYEYTKNMEDELDKIAKGHKIWYTLCEECNTHIDKLLDNIKDESKLEIPIDDNHTYIIGKYGPVIKCFEKEKGKGKDKISFKAIKKDIDINKLKEGLYRLEDILDEKYEKKEDCKKEDYKKDENIKDGYHLGSFDNHDVFIKKGKFGLYVTWGTNSKTLKELGNRPIESITFDEIIKYLEEGSNIIREVSNNISIRKSVKGDYIFFKSEKMKKPIFYKINEFDEDYKICDVQILKSWIKEKYNIF